MFRIEQPYQYSPYSSGMDLDDLLPDQRITIPGELITSDTQFMRGHGTYAVESDINASVMGTISRVNKLLSVTPIKARYTPEIGDLVVGVVTELQLKKWRVDINSRVDATLQLASINLPGGIQRRKTGSDELQMRTFFQEGDLLVAEVQSIYHDGSVALHTRSLKYGKLRNGQFLKLAASRTGGVIRSKQSTIQIKDCDLLLGVNGYAFISMHTSNSLSENVHNNLSEAAALSIYSDVNADIPLHVRDQIARIYNILVAYAQNGIKIDVHMIKEAYEDSIHLDTQDITRLLVVHTAR